MTPLSLRQSPIDHLLTDSIVLGDGQLELRTDKPGGMHKAVFLGDLTHLTEKLGIKGPRAVDWLESQGLQIPSHTYETIRIGSEGLGARIGADEVLLEFPISVAGLTALRKELDAGPEGVWRVEHQEATLMLFGPRAGGVLAQTCGVDFSQIPPDQLIYTRLAVASCAVVRESSWETAVYRLWVDASLAEYLWEELSQIGR